MARRYADALMIDNGACNPSGIVHTILTAINELMSEPGYRGTLHMRSDPAIRLMVNQLSFLMGNGEVDADVHRQLREHIKALAGGHKVEASS